MRALVSIESSRSTLVHPCYWKALDVSIINGAYNVALQINDDYNVVSNKDPIDLRLRRLGRLPEELTEIPLGHAGSRDFEIWVLRAVRVLFSGPLSNIELKPNPTIALNQRDVVGTNATQTTFWRRIYEDYKSRQIIFECKNYEEITPDDFRQVLDYATGEYGDFIIVVRRGKNNIFTENEKDRMKAMFFDHKVLIMIVPVPLLALCIRKLRSPHKKYDYTDFTMNKHLDFIVRSVLSLTHMPQSKSKRRR
jgi:hypothetical protein